MASGKVLCKPESDEQAHPCQAWALEAQSKVRATGPALWGLTPGGGDKASNKQFPEAGGN